MPACPECGAQQPREAAFCDRCGAVLGDATPEVACSGCGTPLESGSKFCYMCGAAVGAASSHAHDPTRLAAPHSPTALSSSVVQGRLVVQGVGITLPLPSGKAEVVIGRKDPLSGAFPDVDLTPYGGEEGGVSRRHARLFVHGTRTFIEDLGSTNGTWVDRSRLVPGEPCPLDDGDEVRLGRVELRFFL